MTLRAKRVAADEARDWMTQFEADAPHRSFCGSLAWTQAARKVTADQAAIGVLFLDGERIVGATIVFEGATTWRSGSPGTTRIEWPMQEFGYGFAPHSADHQEISQWPHAIVALFAREHLELRRNDLSSPPEQSLPGRDSEYRPGPPTWQAPVISEDSWRASLAGRHRRDLDYYVRRIAKREGEWIDLLPTDSAETAARELQACLDLHAARIMHKGQESAYLTGPARAFLDALVQDNAPLRRISRLNVDGKDVASVLSFCYAGHYQCFMPGFDPRVRGLDLGRQGIYHQVRQEFRRGLTKIDLLGGDLAYKAEFGLSPQPTWDFVHRPTRMAALREHAVQGARRAYHRMRP